MQKTIQWAAAAVSIVGLAGCSNLPGTPKQQGAVIGGASGAAVGAAVSKNRALGAVIGGALGAAGGYVIGANKDKISGADKEAGQAAARDAEQNPATPEQARTAATADINADGFVTLDELVALDRAGFSDEEILSRLRATNHMFDLTAEQRKDLLDQGVSQKVVNELPSLNQRNPDSPKPVDRVISRDRPI